MQRQILNDAQNLNLLNDIVKVESINYSADVKNVLVKIGKVPSLYKPGNMDFNLIRYIPGLADVATQGQIYNLNTKRKYADENYEDKNTLEFNIILHTSHYINFNAMHICLPMKMKFKNQKRK